MNRAFHIIPLLLILLGSMACSLFQPKVVKIDQQSLGTYSPEMQETKQAAMKSQSEGLKDGKVTVNRAYNYSGFSYIEPVEKAKLIAVEVTFSDFSMGLDLDDVEIIDGGSDENFGSDPDIVYLSKDGEPLLDDIPTLEDESIRVLLIYAARESTKSIKLGYWGQELLEAPVTLQESGPEMPEH